MKQPQALEPAAVAELSPVLLVSYHHRRRMSMRLFLRCHCLCHALRCLQNCMFRLIHPPESMCTADTPVTILAFHAPIPRSLHWPACGSLHSPTLPCARPSSPSPS